MKRKIFIILFLLFFIPSICFSLTLSDIRGQIRNYIDDPSTDIAKQRWTDTEINFQINQAQRDICDITFCIIKSTSINLVTDTTDYTLPTDFYVTERVIYDGDDILTEVTINAQDRDEETWIVFSSGTPTNYYINKENTKIGLYPVPSAKAAVPNLDVWYIAVPTDLSSDSSVPFNSITKLYAYHHLIIYYVVGHILLEGGDPTAMTWLALCDKGLQRMTNNIKLLPNYVPSLKFQRE